MLEQAITSIGNAVGAWLYVIAGGLAFAEAAILIGMVLPGETGLLVAGVFCQRGVLTLWVMVPVAIILRDRRRHRRLRVRTEVRAAAAPLPARPVGR